MRNNIFRIAIDSKEKSSEAKVLEKKLASLGYDASVEVSKVYTIQYEFSEEQIQKIAHSLYNPIVELIRINSPSNKEFTWALELGFLPGVTDNVANTAAEIINDLFKTKIGRNKVFTSKVLFIKADLKKEDIEIIAKELINTLIERYHIKSYNEYKEDKGMDYIVPKVNITEEQSVAEINLNITDEKLEELGKKGIPDPKTNTRRGPLALDLDYFKAIQSYFKKEGRNPTDIEVESIAQTWSEHCKHTLFAGEIDDIPEGIYKKYIKAATIKVRNDLGENDFCLSVFRDNSGGIIFDENYMITDKAETHNSPSALDPFGGSITGIVGVNRDTIGFGMGALPITNKYGFCLGRPEDKTFIYRGKDRTNPALTPRRIMDGVIYGVNVGGNCSGIPTPTGFVYFDDCYKGKPLIFVGTVGLIPRKLPNNKKSHEKQAQSGDNIVMIGGRVGKDGIHGATFSSEAMDEGSPATAVQIGDPITQKKLSDAVVKEARDKELYNSITDNGAGGLSCSVAEMAKESGGFIVDLEKVPLKYPGLPPWETWISESQERMTLAVPDNKLEEFMDLMEQRGVEATVIGKFNSTDRAVVRFNKRTILDIDMDFLHNGLPKRKLTTKPYNYSTEEPIIKVDNQQKLFEKLLGSHNNSSFEFISKQYDHEVQNNSVIKPLQGKGRVNSPASVIKPLFNNKRCVVMSQSLYPRLSEISCYDMAACAIDTSIRNCVAAGGNINYLALMDNFCWCSSNDPERMYQLKDAAKACYDCATVYKTPFISGKDSMFNDFKGFDEDNNPIKISVLPTLMISGIGIIEDAEHTTTMDLKIAGDLIYIIGKTKDECGGSEFYRIANKIGANSPKVDAKKARALYEKMYELNKKQMLSACASVNQGLLITLAKMSIAGQLGVEADIRDIADLSAEKIFYSESQSRFIVTIDPKDKEKFEEEMDSFDITQIGVVKDSNKFIIKNSKEQIISSDIKQLEDIYKERFKEF
ncbi:phosphoribosylformylglycinamidine synthase [Candidatus Woesearchaeota archaeon]|nr:phosphoribosylformylglycinamidine synthase [Candidatus Woesearchaeota archaeon]